MYTNCSFDTWIPGRYTDQVAFIQGWPLGEVPQYIVSHYFTQQQVNDVRVILLQAEISAGAVANDLEVTRYYCKTALSYNGMDKFLKYLL